MLPLLITCPVLGLRAQILIADDFAASADYVGVTCPACKQIHLVNPRTGRTAGEDDASGS